MLNSKPTTCFTRRRPSCYYAPPTTETVVLLSSNHKKTPPPGGLAEGLLENGLNNRRLSLSVVGIVLLASQLISDGFERQVRVFADRADCCQTDNHDQREHDGIFHRGGAIFRNEELLNLLSKFLHSVLRFSVPPRKADTLGLSGAVWLPFSGRRQCPVAEAAGEPSCTGLGPTITAVLRITQSSGYFLRGDALRRATSLLR